MTQAFAPGILTSTGLGSPFTAPQLWDRVTFAQGLVTFQGKIKFRGARRKFGWQTKPPPGTKGAIYTYRQTKTEPFYMHIWMWTDFQWNQMVQNVSTIFRYDGTKPGADALPNVNPVDIYHPALDFLGIHQVFCHEILAPDVEQERIGWVEVVFKLEEFLPVVAPVNVTKTPTQTLTPVGVASQVTAGAAPASVAVPTQQTAIFNQGVAAGLKGSYP